MAETLAFTITGRDHLGEKLDILARKVDKVSDRLTRLDHQRANPKIDVNVDKPMRKIFGLQKLSSAIPDLIESPFQAVTTNIYALAAVAAAALATLPAAAALAATGIVLAFGGGLAAIGILAAAQSKKVQKAFTDLKDDVVKRVKEMAAPFEPFLLHVADVGRRVFDAFAKPLGDAFAQLAPALTVFSDQLGTAFSNLAPMIRPVTDAFTAILRQLGPRLPDLFKSIGESVAHIAKVVSDNADTFAGLVNFFLRMVPVAVDLTAKLASFFALIVRNMPVVAEASFGAAELILKGVRLMTTAILDNFGFIVEGAAKAFGWMPGIGGKIRTAEKAFDSFRDGVRHALDGAIAKVDEWRRAANNMPKKIKLEGDIRDLQGKIEAAKARLKTVPPSKQTAIRAEISQLQRKLREAKAALASLQDRTVTVRVNTVNVQTLIQTTQRGRQHGGPVAARQAYIVGEKGPELFVSSTPGTIIPNNRLGRAGPGRAATTVNYHINVAVAPTADQATVGGQIVQAIKAYERGAGPRWRK